MSLTKISTPSTAHYRCQQQLYPLADCAAIVCGWLVAGASHQRHHMHGSNSSRHSILFLLLSCSGSSSHRCCFSSCCRCWWSSSKEREARMRGLHHRASAAATGGRDRSAIVTTRSACARWLHIIDRANIYIIQHVLATAAALPTANNTVEHHV